MYVTKWKEANLRRKCCMIPTKYHCGKGKTMETKKRSAVTRGWEGEGWIGNRWSTEDFSESENTLYDIVMDTCHHSFLSKAIECTPRVNPNVHYGLGVIVMCQCRFISCNRSVLLVGDVCRGRSYTCVGTGSILKISVLFPQFCCEPETALKIKS